MASKSVNIDQIVKDALSTVAQKYPEDYKKLSSAQSTKVSEAGRETVSKLLTCLNRKGEKSINDLPHVGLDKMKKNYTYVMTIRSDQGRKLVKITRDGKEFSPTIDLSSQIGVVQAIDAQTVSILIEAVILVLQLIGIHIQDDQATINRAVGVARSALEKSDVVVTEVDAIIAAYRNGSMRSVATAVLRLVIGLHREGVLWDIIRQLLSSMNWYEWILTAVQIAAFIATLVATDGIASIAELVLEVINAAFFLAKLANMATLNAMKTE